MKIFEGKTHYEILKIPLDAGSAEIKRAYFEAMDMYDENALATYSLFSDEQRRAILQAIDEAFHTLADDARRSAYNQMLVATGQVDASSIALKQENSRGSSRKERPVAAPGDPSEHVQQRSSEEKIQGMVDGIMGKGIVSGEDLRQLREAMGIDTTEIYEKTRISRSILESIEQNRYADLPAEIFLKSFLKSLAEILRIDPQHVVAGYLRHRDLSD